MNENTISILNLVSDERELPEPDQLEDHELEGVTGGVSNMGMGW